MPNQVVSLNTAVSPYEADLAQIAQRQKFAELLQQQATSPEQPFSYNGIQAPIPATAGLAKILAGALSGYAANKNIQDQLDLSTKAQTAASNWITKLTQDTQAQPAVPGSVAATPADVEDRQQGIDMGSGATPMTSGQAIPVPGGQGEGANVGSPATQGMNQQQRLAMLMTGMQNPVSAQIAGPMLAQMLKGPNYGTTFQNVTKNPESYTGWSATIVDKNTGDTKVIPVPAPTNQFTSQTVNSKAELDQQRQISDRAFYNLSKDQQAQIGQRAQQLGISAAELYFNTGFGRAPEGTALPTPTVPGATPVVPASPVRVAPANSAPQPNPASAPVAQTPAQATDSAPVPLVNDPKITPKEQQALKVAQPKTQQALSAVNTSVDKTTQLINSILDNTEGLDRSTNVIMGNPLMPTIRQSSKDYETDLKTLNSQLALRALADLRAASSTGGGVGSVSEGEYPILAAQFGNLAQTQDPQKIRKTLGEIKDTLARIKSRTTQAYTQTYGADQPTAQSSTPSAPRVVNW